MLQDILEPGKEYVQAYLVHFFGESPTLGIYCPNDHILSNDMASVELIPPIVPFTDDPYLRTPFVVEYEWGNGNPIHSFDDDNLSIRRAQDLVNGSESPTQLYLPINIIKDIFKAGNSYNEDQVFFAGVGKIMEPSQRPRSDANFRNNGAIFLRAAFDYLSLAEHEMSDADIPSPTETLDDVVMFD